MEMQNNLIIGKPLERVKRVWNRKIIWNFVALKRIVSNCAKQKSIWFPSSDEVVKSALAEGVPEGRGGARICAAAVISQSFRVFESDGTD